MNEFDVTVAIVTYNRADTLRMALESLAQQETHGDFTYEIVVVDNGSTDDTQEVIRSANPGNALAIRYVLESEQGVAAARNRSIAASRGEWIAFHDDDQVAEPDWLSELLHTAAQRDCLVVGGDVRLRLPESNCRKLSGTCRRLLGEMVGMKEPCRFTRRLVPATNNLMVHRSVFDAVGRFEELCLTGGEDADLYRRIRAADYECWYTPNAVVHHLIPSQRLEPAYMRWTSLRQGGHVAHRELSDWGLPAFPLALCARIGQALASYLPKYVTAQVVKDTEAALGARCLLWRTEGYVRFGLHSLAPRIFYADAFLSALNFRNGRERLVSAATSAPASRRAESVSPALGAPSSSSSTRKVVARAQYSEQNEVTSPAAVASPAPVSSS